MSAKRSAPILVESLESRQLLSSHSLLDFHAGRRVPGDSAGNTLAAARNLGTISASKHVSESVGARDTRDYFKLHLASAGVLNLSLTGNSTAVSLKLLSARGSGIATAAGKGTTTRTLHRTLAAGTYFVLVAQSSGTENYTLTLSSAGGGGGGADGAGNTLATARNIGSAIPAKTFNDFVGPNDAADIYKLSLAQGGDVSIDMTNLHDDADVHLAQDSNGDGRIEDSEIIGRSENSDTSNEHIGQSLDAGTYYILVIPGGSTNATTYTLTVAATPQDTVGDDISDAQDVGELSDAQTFTDSVGGSSDPADFYQFTLSQQSDVSIALTGLKADADIQLIQDTNGDGQVDDTEIIDQSENAGTASEQINHTLDAGTYFVNVAPGAGAATAYILTMSAAPVEAGGGGGGDQVVTDLGEVDGTTQVNDLVAAGSENVYTFSVPSSGRLVLALTDLSDDANLLLYRDPNGNGGLGQAQPLAKSQQAGTHSELIEINVPAGQYAIHVVGGNDVGYTLTAIFVPS
jgi:hypothetical protein